MFLHCAAIGTKLVNARFYLSKPCLDKIPENGDNNFIFLFSFLLSSTLALTSLASASPTLIRKPHTLTSYKYVVIL